LFERKHRWGKESLLIRLKCLGEETTGILGQEGESNRFPFVHVIGTHSSVDSDILGPSPAMRCLIFLQGFLCSSCSHGTDSVSVVPGDELKGFVTQEDGEWELNNNDPLV